MNTLANRNGKRLIGITWATHDQRPTTIDTNRRGQELRADLADEQCSGALLQRLRDVPVVESYAAEFAERFVAGEDHEQLGGVLLADTGAKVPLGVEVACEALDLAAAVCALALDEVAAAGSTASTP